jgi:hypothetical protein
VLISDGRAFPSAHVGDLLGLSVSRDVISGFRVLAVGGSAADAPDRGTQLASDELILDFCPALASIAGLPVHIENAGALRNEPQRGTA